MTLETLLKLTGTDSLVQLYSVNKCVTHFYHVDLLQPLCPRLAHPTETSNRALQSTVTATIKQSSTIDSYRDNQTELYNRQSNKALQLTVTATIKQSSTIDGYSNNQTELYNRRLQQQTELYK